MSIKDDIYQFSIFGPHTIVCCSTRKIGTIKTNRQINSQNIQKFAKRLKINPKNIYQMDQRHTGTVAFVDKRSFKESRETDGLITKEKNILLMVVTADCVPIVFSQEQEGLVGVAHAGYKGILNGIIENMISILQKQGGYMEDLKVGIGPSIGVCCYNIPAQRVDSFKKKYPKFKNFYQKRNNTYFLNLQSIVCQVLETYGIRLENIEHANTCTSCNTDMFFSYRRDSADSFGEFATIVGIV